MTEALTLDVLVTHDPPKEVGVSEWMTVTQEMMNQFGAVTFDPDPMHIDPAWARQNGPFGGTIAFGFFTVSILTHLLLGAMRAGAQREAATTGLYLNYGFNRLRLVSPVPVGARIRGRFEMVDRRLDPKGHWVITLASTVEIEGQERPALVADWLSVWMPAERTAIEQGT